MSGIRNEKHYSLFLLLFAGFLAGCGGAGDEAGRKALVRQVVDTERAFARTMADRDHEAFIAFISDEAVFVSEDEILRGRDEVAGRWKRYFEGERAPFSWEPERVEVLESGNLALSTGPVYGPGGEPIGTFTSVWRLEATDRWRVIFDSGCPACEGAE